MRIAAYQAPLLPGGSLEAIELIRRRVEQCEAAGVEILCCPEAVLGGLADDALRPAEIAIGVEDGQLETVLAPLANRTVTIIVGFTEITANGNLHNTAAVFQRGRVAGLYRKLHPAINRSIYRPGEQMPVFTIGGLTFGIIICNDSNFVEPVREMARQGATVIFIPTNNALPPQKADVIAETRAVDIARAKENRVWVIRADVAGRAADRVSYGSSSIVAPDGNVAQTARQFTEDLLIMEIDVS